MVLTSTPAFDARLAYWKPVVSAVLGTLIAVMASLIVAFFTLQREAQLNATRQLAAEVAERRATEEQLSLAVRDLGHRVKNTLTVVTAIASQTVRHSDSLVSFERAFRLRLQALGRVHDLLTVGRTYATELGSLVAEVLNPYQDQESPRVFARGDQVELQPDATIMLSVLFNELATKATKYGALSGTGGRIDLTWEREGHGHDGVLRLIWEESGGPAVAEPSHAGFGTNVTKFVIERRLKAGP